MASRGNLRLVRAFAHNRGSARVLAPSDAAALWLKVNARQPGCLMLYGDLKRLLHTLRAVVARH